MARRKFRFTLSKREKFIASILFLSVCLFATLHLFGKSSLYVALLLSASTVALFIASMYKDIRGNFSLYSIILPFFFTLAVALFSLLIPARFLSRAIITMLYAVGLYSLFLSQNIFIVASIRTIALLTGARIVSFVITLLSYFFLSSVVFSLHLPLLVVIPLVAGYTFPLVLHSLWTITLDKSWRTNALWAAALSLCLLQTAVVLWFWPAQSTLVALFLTGFFYTIVGLSQVWLDRRLFKGVIWEYIWVAFLIFCILMVFTAWSA